MYKFKTSEVLTLSLIQIVLWLIVFKISRYLLLEFYTPTKIGVKELFLYKIFTNLSWVSFSLIVFTSNFILKIIGKYKLQSIILLQIALITLFQLQNINNTPFRTLHFILVGIMTISSSLFFLYLYKNNHK